MRITACALAALAVVLAMPSPTMAQERKGFWIGAGVGVGSAAVRCDSCDEGRDVGAAVNIKLGGTVNERLLIGAEFNTFVIGGEAKVLTGTGALLAEDVPITTFLFNVLGTVTFYPKTSSGFFLKGGAGVSVVDIDVDLVGEAFTVELGDGFGLVAGAGYDLPVGRKLSVTPAVNFWYGRLGNAEVAGGTLKNWKHNVVDFTVGITFH